MEGINGSWGLVFSFMLLATLLLSSVAIIVMIAVFCIGIIKLEQPRMRYIALPICFFVNEAYLLIFYGDEYTEIIRVIASIITILLLFFAGIGLGRLIDSNLEKTGKTNT